MQALAHRALDGAHTWQQGAISFGQQIMYLTPESRHERLPWYEAEADLAITADVRLDNRVDLCRLLDIPHPERGHITDSQLILKAYQAWDEHCPEHLLGDFAFAIWDGRKRRLFCCRDQLRGRPFFYACDAGRFIFASEIKGILAVPGVPRRLNAARLAATEWPGAHLVANETTFYQDVSLLPPAMSLSVDQSGLRQRRYWQLDPHVTLSYKRHGDILEAFEALMFDVIGGYCRRAFPVTILLSGGLDSSAIVSVAARYLEQQGQQLTVLSAVKADPNDHDIADERYFIDQFQAWPNVIMHYITAPQRGPFDDVERVVWGYDSPLASPCHYLYTAFAEAMQQCDARVMLTGDGGELGPTFDGVGYYSELLLRWRWLTLARELRQRSRVAGVRPRRVMTSSVLRPFYPIWALRWYSAWRNRGGHGVLQPTFLRQHLRACWPAYKRARTTVQQLWPNQRRNHHHLITCWQQKNPGTEGFVGYERVRMAVPLADTRLLEFCLAVPGDLKVRHGYTRYLVRAGLDGILPSAIQWRTTKHPFSPDYQRRYNTQRQQAHDMLAAIGPHDPVREVVNVEQLRRLAAPEMQHQRGLTPADRAAQDCVPFGISVITFLRQFAEFRS